MELAIVVVLIQIKSGISQTPRRAWLIGMKTSLGTILMLLGPILRRSKSGRVTGRNRSSGDAR
jgi:hypothetical protein